MFVPLSRPDITEREISAVTELMTGGILSIGPKVTEFERIFAEYVGVEYAVAVNSGTSALHLVIRSLDLKRGQTVITSPFTFVSSANVALYEGAIPIFADIEESTLNVSPETLEEALANYSRDGLDTGAIKLDPFVPDIFMAVDIFGHPLEWDRIEGICNKHGIKIVEDSCEALGSSFMGRKTGTFGLAGTFAFYPNKQITTGEGGMIVTDDSNIAELSKSMRNQGRGVSENWLEHVRLGYNYRMDEMSAALGVEQMKRIDEILEKRQRVADRYERLLSNISGIETPFVANYATSIGWFVYVIKLDEKIDRKSFMNYLTENGVQCRDYFRPIHLQPFYMQDFGYREGMFPVTERLAKRTVAIPFFNNLSEEEMQFVSYTIEKAVEFAG
ncbi:Glutamine--scyllo-inositol transaminase [Mesotoga infera]|nr:perosamine synthetase [Mesotoga sp.]CCU84451.1 Glutamine--scyllo-inositol transaminase [Mesotoga infera]